MHSVIGALPAAIWVAGCATGEGAAASASQVAHATSEQATTVDEVSRTAHESAKVADFLQIQARHFAL